MKIFNQHIIAIFLSLNFFYSYPYQVLALENYQQIIFHNSNPDESFNAHSALTSYQQGHYHDNFECCYKNSRQQCIDTVIFNAFSPQIIAQLCNNESEQVLFSQYHLYSNPTYLGHLRSCPGYENFILDLHKKIQANHDFRKSLRSMSGFKEKLGFQNLIDHEVTAINQIREDQTLKEQIRKTAAEAQAISRLNKNLETTKNLLDHYVQKSSEALKNGYTGLTKRYQKKIIAIANTRDQNFQARDYSNDVSKQSIIDPYQKIFDYQYGTELDKLLHEELCDTRTKAAALNSQYAYDFHVQKGVPLVQYYTALAKTQPDLEVAFNLSDVAHGLLQALSAGAELVVKATSATGQGIFCAAKTVLSPEHWKQMAHGIVSIGSTILNEIRKQEELDRALWAKDPKIYYDAVEKHHQESKAQFEAIRDHYHTTLAMIKKMSWNELLKHSIELGTSMVLDTLLLNAGASLLSKIGSEVITEATHLLKAKNAIAGEYVTEVAGFGKMAITEAFETTNTALRLIENNPILLEQGGAKSLTNIMQHVVEEVNTAKKAVNAGAKMYTEEQLVQNIIQKTTNASEMTITRAAVTEELIDKLLKAGNMFDKGDLTAAGRALQKHGSRTDSVFPKATGNATIINAQGETVLKDILSHPSAIPVIRHHARFGDILEYKIPEGRGVRFSSDSKIFIGFIEP